MYIVRSHIKNICHFLGRQSSILTTETTNLMSKGMRRIRGLLSSHINFLKRFYSTPSIHVTPSTALVDQKVELIVEGLKPKETVTLVADVEENRCRFQSRGVFEADENGTIHNETSSSIAGTFTGTNPMGLFWSLQPNSGIRLIKKDVSRPLTYDINLYSGAHTDKQDIDVSPLTSVQVQRFFKKPKVRRIPVTDGRFRGTIFVPEGKGPFPALIDLFGAVVTIIETRAALLASYGYTVFALTYLYADGLPQMMLEADRTYIKEAAEWFTQQEFVDDQRVGTIGICFGGTLCLNLTANFSKIKAAVNVNGAPLDSDGKFEKQYFPKDEVGPPYDLIYHTEEGVIINNISDFVGPNYIPAWQHGAKVLEFCGEDDKQVHPKWHRLYEQNWPGEWKLNFELVTYPGAGHLIEPPYTPLCRAVNAGRKRLSTIDFIPSKYHDKPLICGGYPEQHAFAQEDSWNRVLKFLDKNLKNLHQ